MSDRIAQAGLALLAALLIGAGLIAVGGPEEARRQKRDDGRFQAIQHLAGCFAQLDAKTYHALPPDLADYTPCVSILGWNDPQTAEPYRFQRREGDRFSVCARFERPESQRTQRSDLTFDPATGCVTGKWQGPADLRPMDQFEVVPN